MFEPSLYDDTLSFWQDVVLASFISDSSLQGNMVEVDSMGVVGAAHRMAPSGAHREFYQHRKSNGVNVQPRRHKK